MSSQDIQKTSQGLVFHTPAKYKIKLQGGGDIGKMEMRSRRSWTSHMQTSQDHTETGPHNLSRVTHNPFLPSYSYIPSLLGHQVSMWSYQTKN